MKAAARTKTEKTRQVRSNVKVLLTVFFDFRGVVHHEFLPQGRTVNKEYYLQVMRNLREAIRQKRPDLWKNKNWLLHHDNAPAHTSLLVRDLLAKNNALMMPQPPYSPELAPCDFFLFPKLKRPMKGRRYAMLDEIKTASKEELKNIFFFKYFLMCFEDWKNRWHKCIISHGDYLEGDKIEVFLDPKRIILMNISKQYIFGHLINIYNIVISREEIGENPRTINPTVRGCIPNVDCGIRRSYLGPKQRYRWYKMFSEGREDVNDEERAGRPSTSTTDEKINEVKKMILANRRITVREVAEDLNISIGSCDSIFFNDLGMRRVAAKFVPKLLNCDQKQHRKNIANEMLDAVRDDPNLLQRVITGDEAWGYSYDVETKAQSSQWKLSHEPRPTKARQVRSNVKVLLTVFFDCRGVVHHEFLRQGRTVNKEYYLLVMRNLREAIRQKRPDLWKNKNWLLHHDNAPAHTSLLVRDFLAKNNTLMMPQPPYSPDLAPCDFFLFP
ncbi:hypothetical protein LAZ67_X001029 [Cordylochernes scorpioides]|uniref:Transposase n=1 Tax=Cordylochernes scorpioides TaxID=51811 RepID=A0ABY6LUR9_9ARAC|nr:hypothetical protein LAZ67_X001029 [Cordylochernes scorpioides]